VQLPRKLTAYERISLTIDTGTFTERYKSITPGDPLSFVDGKGPYQAKVDAARAKTKLNESVVTGDGEIDGIPVAIAVMDFRFLGGSLGSGTGEKILRVSNYAVDKGVAAHHLQRIRRGPHAGGRLVAHADAKTCAGISRLNRERIPYISVLTDRRPAGSRRVSPCGDVNIAEPGAVIGFAGRRCDRADDQPDAAR